MCSDGIDCGVDNIKVATVYIPQSKALVLSESD